MVRTSDFQSGNRSSILRGATILTMSSHLRYYFGLVSKKKRLVAQLGALIVLGTALRLVQPFLYKIIVDILTHGLTLGFSPQDQTHLIELVAGWFFLALSGNIVGPQVLYLGWNMGNQIMTAFSHDAYRRTLRLDWEQHTKKHSSEHAKLLENGNDALWRMNEWWLNRIIPSLFGFVAMLCLAFWVNWKMTLVSLTVIPLGLTVIIVILTRAEEEQREVNQLWEKINEHASDQIGNIITYKLNQDERLFLKTHHDIFTRARDRQVRMNKKWRLVSMLNPDILAHFLVMGMGVLLVKNGEITLGTLFMFMGLLNEILIPLHLMGDILPEYSRRARQIERALKFMTQEDAIQDPKHPLLLKTVHGKIEFQKVSFRYNSKKEDDHALSNLSFMVEPGQHLAIVGHTGAGKSTVMALLTRLADPTSGAVLLDGVDIRKFRQEDYRRFIGTVLQEHSLYNETIARNISYSKPHATRAEIIAAARLAQADDFIARLPKGYDTEIGERGVRLSGGEKQRLAIARAILKNPKIVMLDEPTSALDSITEAKVQQALDKLVAGRTSIVIAHRLATVRHANKILVMEKGRQIAFGSHEELLKICATYHEMVNLQTGGFLAEE